MPGVKRILFVCYGNIIRSPLAENLFRRVVQEAGAEERYQADSAGTSGLYDGAPPHPSIERVARAHGLHLTGHSRRIQVEDFDRFNLIVALDREVARDLTLLAHSEGDREKIRLLRSFDPRARGQTSVPDPIGSGPEAFEHTYAVVERSVRGLFEALESGQL